MSVTPKFGARYTVRRFLSVVLFIIVLSTTTSVVNHDATGQAPTIHKYVIMLTVSDDPTLEKTMDQSFLTAIKSDSDARKLSVTASGLPWTNTQICRRGQECDRLSIFHTGKLRQLMISCNGDPPLELPAPPCVAPEKDKQMVCMPKLKKDLVQVLWNHSKSSHKGRDW